VVEKSDIIDGRGIAAGDAVLGLGSSGPHSNGFSLIRKIIDKSGVDLASPFGSTTLGAALLAPTRIYVKPVLALMHAVPVKGMAHITGGGIVENVPRMLPPGLQARITRSSWQRPPIFDWLQRHGNVADAEMHRVFNCGIGMAVVVAPEHAERALRMLDAHGERAQRIGTIVAQPAGEPPTVVA